MEKSLISQLDVAVLGHVDCKHHDSCQNMLADRFGGNAVDYIPAHATDDARVFVSCGGTGEGVLFD